MKLPKLNKRNLAIFLAVLGPGLITAAVDNDAGGITTYSIAGAHFGFTTLWLLLPIGLLLIVTQEMGARLGIVTGKGLSDLIRENFGVKLTVALMAGLFLTNWANAVAEFAGIAAASQLLGMNPLITVPLSGILVWALVVKANYKTVEKAFLIAIVFYLAYAIAAVMAQPDWGHALSQTVTPVFDFTPSYLLVLVALIGATIAPWMQFYVQAAIVEKGIKAKELVYARADVVAGSVVTLLVMFFIIVTCATVLYPQGVQIESAWDAAKALAPFAGEYASALFAFGLLTASLFAAAILPLATAFTICESFGWESGVNKKLEEAPQFYGLFTFLIASSGLIVLVPQLPLVLVMYLSQALNGIFLPVILVLLLLLINKKSLMGKHVNGRAYNAFAWAATIAISLISLVLVLEPLL
ncbi:MAG: Nramp family divalent metal transporter [Candidatus Micrarchaeota archaeon]